MEPSHQPKTADWVEGQGVNLRHSSRQDDCGLETRVSRQKHKIEVYGSEDPEIPEGKRKSDKFAGNHHSPGLAVQKTTGERLKLKSGKSSQPPRPLPHTKELLGVGSFPVRSLWHRVEARH